MNSETYAVQRPECEQHRREIEERIDRQVRDLRTDLLAEVERRDAERRDDYQTLTGWMARIDRQVNALPETCQAIIDKKFDRLFQAMVAIILEIIIAGLLAYLGLAGGL